MNDEAGHKFKVDQLVDYRPKAAAAKLSVLPTK